ncbi:MAG TPA: pyridine nucleotide-disulfide oxidoreductase, partial [Burkholderiales bacterium]
TPLPGVPFDEARAVVPNRAGRVVGVDTQPASLLYVTGWLKRGPTGIIGTNKADSMETVATLLSELPNLANMRKEGAERLARHLDMCSHMYVNYADWKRIDEHEVLRGIPIGKPREKLVIEREMLRAAGKVTV